MARNFNGTSAFITLDAGGLGTPAGHVIAVIARNTAANNSFRGMVTVSDSGGNVVLALGRDNQNDLCMDMGAGGLFDAPTIESLSTDGWALYVARKASGSAAIRFHEYIYSTNTFTSENDTVNMSDAGAAAASVRIGCWRDSGGEGDFWGGDILAVGIWNTEALTTDDDVRSLAFNLQRWLSATELYLLDQSATTQAVKSITGTSAQTAITGTTVGTSSVPLFNRWDDGLYVTKSSGAAGTTLSPESIVQTRAQGTPVVSPSLLPASLTHTRALGASVLNTQLLPASLVHTRALGDPTVTVGFNLTPESIVHTRAQGTPILNPQLLPASLAHTRALGDPVASTGSVVSPGSIEHTRAQGTPVFSPQILMPSIVHDRALGDSAAGTDGDLVPTRRMTGYGA